MKKSSFLLIMFIILGGCESAKQKANEAKQDSLTQVAELSKEKISELPLGFHFGMSVYEVNCNLNDLIDKGIMSINGEYVYITNQGDSIKCMIEFGYHAGELYRLTMKLAYMHQQEAIDAIKTDLAQKLDSTYTNVGYEEDYGGKEKFSSYKWFKKNQIIFLKNARGVDLNYINAPIDKIVSDIHRKGYIEDAMKNANNVDVKNSSWDNSVSQVKDYLKSSLKDPDSYESIEWSEVTKTDSGYAVRHKYRAKNSLGGYVVENQIFYLNKKGEVTNTKNY